MGCRPLNAQGDWPRLDENDASEVAKFTADLVHQCPARLGMGFAADVANSKQSLDARGSLSDEPSRASLEAALTGLAGIFPRFGEAIVGIICRPFAKAAVDEPKGMTNTRKSRNRLGIIESFVGLRLRDQVEHSSGLSRTRLKNS